MFDSRNQKPILDPITTSDYTYNKTYQNFVTKNEVGGLEMSQQHVDYGDDESGICSAPLWKNSPPRSPVHPFQNSPSSRALAIAKGQWELMEMIKNMPESCYELSLKDLVEKNSILESNQEECLINKEEEKENLASTISQEHVVMQQRVKSIKTQESKGEMIRNESFEERGCCLKMFFPIPLDPKKKQQMKKSTKTTKVSPKPIEVSRNLEKDWWKKRFSCSSESDSSKTGSSNSESSGSNDSRTTTKRYLQILDFSIQ